MCSADDISRNLVVALILEVLACDSTQKCILLYSHKGVQEYGKCPGIGQSILTIKPMIISLWFLSLSNQSSYHMCIANFYVYLCIGDFYAFTTLQRDTCMTLV